MLVSLALGLHLLLLGLLVGFMVVVEWSLVPAQNALSATAYATLEQGMNRVLERLTPALMVGALVAGAGALWLVVADDRPGAVSWLLAAGVGGLASMVVSTLVINAPVNSAIDDWDREAPPADWQTLRDRWERGHRLRSYVGLLALCCSIAAAVWPR